MSDYLVDLESDERVIAEVRKHMFIFYARAFWLLVLALLPLFISRQFVSFVSTRADINAVALFAFLYLLWVLIFFVLFFFRWTDYYLDVWVITDKRIFDIEQRGTFNRDTSVFRLDRVQDVTVTVEGVLATFIKYGDVHIHTAGESTDFVIKNAANPLEVKRVIMEQHSKAIREQNISGTTQR